jgi:hypothetical protein
MERDMLSSAGTEDTKIINITGTEIGNLVGIRSFEQD